MNIKEIKSNYEKATQIVIKSMVQSEVNVQTAYNLDQSILVASLTSETKGQNEEPIIIAYNVVYREEEKTISVAAMARHFMMDNIGLSNIIYEPIPVDESFLSNMKAGIMTALEQPEAIIKAEEERLEKEKEEKESTEEKNPEVESVEPEVVDGEESVAN